MQTEKWSGYTSQGNVLSTELNSLGNGSYCSAGSAYDNTTNLDRFGVAELSVTFGTAPTSDSPIHLFAVIAPDGGTNYTDGGGSVRPPDAVYLGTFQLRNVTTAQIVHTKRFELPPGKMKFVAYNGSGQSFPASGSTVKLFTFNRTIG